VDYLDLYLSHTPFAFQPGDEQDPHDQDGNVIYDRGITLLDTWRAMENLVDRGKCRAIGLSDIGLEELQPLYEAARIKPAVIQVESHPYLPETELLEFCKARGIVLLAFAPFGAWNKARSNRGPGHLGRRKASRKDTCTGHAGVGSTTWDRSANYP
jgi:aldehyde reductase